MIVSSTYIEDMRLARWVFHAVEFTVASLAYLLSAYYKYLFPADIFRPIDNL